MGKQDENLDDDLDMEGLSDEERAALEDDDDDLDALKNIVGEDGDDSDDEDEDSDSDADSGDDDHAGDDEAIANAGDDAAGDSNLDNAADDGKAGEADESPAPVAAEFQPEFRTQVPEGLAEKITALDTRTSELLQKFKEGEIELPEFMAQKGEIDNERMQLTLAQKQAEWAQRQNEEARAQRWQWEQERFFGQAKAGIYKDPIMLGALEASMKQLATDKAHASKPPSFFLEEADRQVRQRFNIADTTKANDKVKETKQRRDPDMSKLPKTLAELPAADIAETGADEFAYLDKLEGIALEQALRKLTPEQEARYLGVSA